MERKKMSPETVAKLRALPRTPAKRCTTCRSWQTYLNPIAICDQCKKPYCYDHISIRIIKDGTEDYCNSCG